MNDENVSISVIIPVYNTPIPFLDEYFNFIFASSYKCFEIIIVDDCSDQCVYEYLNELKELDTRVKLIDAHRGQQKPEIMGCYRLAVNICCFWIQMIYTTSICLKRCTIA